MNVSNRLLNRKRSGFLALVIVIAVALFAIAPAVMAQIPLGQEFSERRITSGAASPSTKISNSGNNVNLCPTVQQIANTGNVANEQGVSQYNTGNNPGIEGYRSRFFDFFDDFDEGDINFEGSSINIDGTVSGECTQTI